MSPPSLSRKGIRKERKKLQPIFVRKAKIEEERVDEKVDEKNRRHERKAGCCEHRWSSRTAILSQLQYNWFDRNNWLLVVVSIGASSSKTGIRRYTSLKWQENVWVHRKNTRDIASSRAYSFPSSIFHSNLHHLWTNPKCNIALSEDCVYDSSAQGLLLRRLYLAQWHICSYL